MKILFVVLASCLATAASKKSPVAEAQFELKLLAEHCPKLPAAGGSCPDLQKAALHAEELCLATHKTYSEALAKAREKVRETKKWMATKKMVNETEDTIYISFNLRDDPDYPMIDSDNILNEALRESLNNMDLVSDDIKEIREKRSCSEAEIKRFYAAWSPGSQGGVNRAHNNTARAISNYLIGAIRAFESGAHEGALKALERETGATVTKVK